MDEPAGLGALVSPDPLAARPIEVPEAAGVVAKQDPVDRGGRKAQRRRSAHRPSEDSESARRKWAAHAVLPVDTDTSNLLRYQAAFELSMDRKLMWLEVSARPEERPPRTHPARGDREPDDAGDVREDTLRESENCKTDSEPGGADGR